MLYNYCLYTCDNLFCIFCHLHRRSKYAPSCRSSKQNQRLSAGPVRVHIEWNTNIEWSLFDQPGAVTSWALPQGEMFFADGCLDWWLSLFQCHQWATGINCYNGFIRPVITAKIIHVSVSLISNACEMLLRHGRGSRNSWLWVNKLWCCYSLLALLNA